MPPLGALDDGDDDDECDDDDDDRHTDDTERLTLAFRFGCMRSADGRNSSAPDAERERITFVAFVIAAFGAHRSSRRDVAL